MKILDKILLLSVISAIVIYAYWYLPLTFFQQDEWSTFGRFIYQEAKGGLVNILLFPFLIGKGHFVPLSAYQTYFELKLFGLSFAPFAYVSILTHIINSFLVFYLAWLLFRNKILAFASGFLFAVNSISSQAIIWIAASPNTQGAVSCLLLSLIFILKYFHDDKKIRYYLSLFFFFIGLLFKESIIFFFFLSPFMWILYTDKKNWGKFFEFLKPLFSLGIIYFVIRVFLFLIPSPFITTSSNAVNLSIASDFFRLLSLPFKILSQSIIPQSFLVSLSDRAVTLFYPQFVLSDGSANPFISQTVIFDQVVYFLSGVMLLFGLLIYKFLTQRKEKNLSKALVFSFILIMLSSLPFAFIPGGAANFSIFEPRDLHASSIGVSIFIAVIIYGISISVFKRKRMQYFLFFLLFVSILFFHVRDVRSDVRNVLQMSIVRKSILNSIQNTYPNFEQNRVFYIESDTAYYGLPESEKIPPFQSGFGRTLLVWYYFHGQKFPSCFFENVWLYDLLEQGYKKCEGRSFGYYRNYKDLMSAVKQYSIPQYAIIAFSWNGKTASFTDISDSIKKRLIIDK